MIWGVELEFSDQTKRSVFYSARRVVLDGEFVQIQLRDGSYTTYPVAKIRKILSMRSEQVVAYTDEDTNADEIY